jgi:pilus assembly protein Flp/PilA
MSRSLWKFTTILTSLLREDAQDLVEYALVVALIAFAATVGMGKVATKIEASYVTISTAISNNIT